MSEQKKRTIVIGSISSKDEWGDRANQSELTDLQNEEYVPTTQPSEEAVSSEADTPDTISDEKKSIYEVLEEDIMASDMPDAEKTQCLSRLIKIRSKKVNIMLTGAAGSGKSSTVNALFDMNVAKVGTGVDPETTCISKFELDNLVIWDTPGLGDGIENDERITKDAIEKLNEMDEQGNPLIDMVIVILDASSKDLGTSYDLINNILIPCLGEDARERILVALNQSDIAMKGTHWIADKNEPDDVLKEYLKKKVHSIQTRIMVATKLDIQPVCYCAGYTEENGEQRKPYNLTKLLYYIMKAVPKDKRLALADNINSEEDNWLYDDHEYDYRGGTKRGFCDTVWSCITDGADTGSDIGSEILGIPGAIIGRAIGGVVGAIGGVFEAVSG